MVKKKKTTEKTNPPRLQSKAVERWKEKYLAQGVEISYCRFDKPTWIMKSSNARFVMYNSAIEISDITNLEENIALFRKEYPALLGADIERMLKAYPDDRKIKEDKLFRIVEYKPDITFICTNGRLGNMNVK